VNDAMDAGDEWEATVLGRLRPVDDEDLEPMRRWRNEPVIRMNMFTRHVIGAEEHRNWWARTRANPAFEYYMLEHAGRACGVGALTGIDRGNANTAWAIYAAPDAPRGTGTRIGALLLDRAFAGLSLHKVHCEAFAFNDTALALYHRLGFVTEGVFREQHDYDGRFVDVHRLGVLRADWLTRRAGILQRLSVSLGTQR
jgi:UDP-4-amino-4,6-dideoxy-N-acetyl-beta-L-altrosamine N-acetyltransferase